MNESEIKAYVSNLGKKVENNFSLTHERISS